MLFTEIARRRRTRRGGRGHLSLLLAATDEDGSTLTDQQVRDQVITLLFAGHDTTTSTVAFLLYELPATRRDGAAARGARRRARRRAADRGQLMGGGLPRLEMVLDETLRLYPPRGSARGARSRRSSSTGVTVPAGRPVNYCSWASHRLPDVLDDP